MSDRKWVFLKKFNKNYWTRQFEILNSDVGHLDKPLPSRSKKHITYVGIIIPLFSDHDGNERTTHFLTIT